MQGTHAASRNLLRLMAATILCGVSAAKVIVQPSSLTIGAFTDGKTALSLTKNIVVFSDTAVALTLDSHDLKTDKDIAYAAENIKLASAVNVPEKAWMVVPLTFAGIASPGIYRGQVRFRGLLDPVDSGHGVAIELTLRGRPKVVMNSGALSAFHCLWKTSCALAAWIATPVETVSISNQDGLDTAQFDSVTVSLRATRSSTVLPARTVALIPDRPIVAGDQASIAVNPPSELSPGRYEGFVRAVLRNGDPVSANVTLDVRDAPWMAMILLIAGILMGRLVQTVNSPAAQAQQKLFAHLIPLEAAAQSLSDRRVASLVGQKLAAARDAISEMSLDENSLSQQLQGIGNAIEIARSLDAMRAELDGLKPEIAKQISDLIEQSADALLGDNPDVAETQRRAAQQLLLISLPSEAPPHRRLALEAMEPQFNEPSVSPTPRTAKNWRLRALESMAGIRSSPVERRFEILRPILFIGLLVALTILGLFTLYVKNPTFGADRLFDYAGLVMWGLSADVAQRTLQNVQLSR